MAIYPIQNPDELEGDYLRRLGRFFLKLALFLAPLNAIWFGFFKATWPFMQDGWRIYVFGLTTMLLPTTMVVAFIGGWANYVLSLRKARSPAPQFSELLILGSSCVLMALLGGAAFYFAGDGLLTGTVRLKGGWANVVTDPALYWFWEFFWSGCAIGIAYGGSKQCWSSFQKIRSRPLTDCSSGTPRKRGAP